MDSKEKVKMRDLGIFKNKIDLTTSKVKGKLMLHQDDMPAYCSWFLVEHHLVDNVAFRGEPAKLTTAIMDKYNLSKEAIDNSLVKLGNPKSIIITVSSQDTY